MHAAVAAAKHAAEARHVTEMAELRKQLEEERERAVVEATRVASQVNNTELAGVRAVYLRTALPLLCLAALGC